MFVDSNLQVENPCRQLAYTVFFHDDISNCINNLKCMFNVNNNILSLLRLAGK